MAITTTPTASMALTDRMLTEAEAAEYLAVKPQTLACWRSNGRVALPFVRLSPKAVRYRLSAVEQFLKARTITPQGGVGNN